MSASLEIVEHIKETLGYGKIKWSNTDWPVWKHDNVTVFLQNTTVIIGLSYTGKEGWKTIELVGEVELSDPKAFDKIIGIIQSFFGTGK